MVVRGEGRAISRLPTEYNGGTCRKLTESYMEITNQNPLTPIPQGMNKDGSLR